jgi:hypothetical protein
MRLHRTTLWLSIAGGAAFVVSLGLLWREMRIFREAGRDYEQSRRQLEHFYRMNPFPSADNVVVEKENAQTIRHWRDQIVAALVEGQAPVRPVNPAVFQKMFSEKRAKWTKVAEQQKVELPAGGGFAFGFEKYAGGELPDSKHSDRLAEQLAVVDLLCGMMFDENVRSVTRIGRDEFDVERSARPLGASARPAVGSADKHKDSLEKFREKSRFTLEFTAREPTVIRLINRVSGHPAFMAIVSLEIVGVSDPLRKTVVAEAGRAAVSAEPPAEPSALPSAVPDLPPERPDRIVSGPSLDNLLKVKMELDVYRFKSVGGDAEA